MFKACKYFPVYFSLKDISLDQAMSSTDNLGRPALGVEKCDCPPQYAGLSCQVFMCV